MGFPVRSTGGKAMAGIKPMPYAKLIEENALRTFCEAALTGTCINVGNGDVDDCS
jgi:hypothetical protein